MIAGWFAEIGRMPIRDAFWDGVLRSLRSDRKDSVTNQ